MDKLLTRLDVAPGWKGAVLGFFVAVVAMLSQMGVAMPAWLDDSLLTDVAAVVAIALALVLKATRRSR